jgi:HTH-type transcriptional regulator, competence development regulator
LTASAFGMVIRRLREAKGLTLREVGQLSELDHAYIHRLETGEKEAPSEDALSRLFRALKPTKRHERLLRFLVGRQVPLDLLEPSIIDDPEIAPEDFESAAQMSFRGTAPSGTEAWRRAIERIRNLREEFDRG